MPMEAAGNPVAEMESWTMGNSVIMVTTTTRPFLMRAVKIAPSPPITMESLTICMGRNATRNPSTTSLASAQQPMCSTPAEPNLHQNPSRLISKTFLIEHLLSSPTRVLQPILLAKRGGPILFCNMLPLWINSSWKLCKRPYPLEEIPVAPSL